MLKYLIMFMLLCVGFLISCTTSGPEPTPLPTALPTPLPVTPTAENQLPQTSLLVDGSTTVYPLSQVVVEQFQLLNPDVVLAVEQSSSGNGFKRLCTGEIDIANASRHITPAEIDLCQSNGVAFTELVVGLDGLVLVVPKDNEWLSCLSVTQLKQIWGPAEAETITSWHQIDPSFPAEPFVLYRPELGSGSFDFFTEAVVGEVGLSRPDLIINDTQFLLSRALAQEPFGLGFISFATYTQLSATLKTVAISNGQGCIEPTTTTIANSSYTPLARPLFVYVNQENLLTKAKLYSFVSFYLSTATEAADEAGFVPLPEELNLLVEERFTAQKTGSIFAETASLTNYSLLELLSQD